jgi:ABC-type dipeptide/oligopeptide/nickel transport system permease component
VTLVVGVIYAVVNIIVDVVHAMLDPRVAETL